MSRLTPLVAAFTALALPLDAHAGSVIAFDRASALPNERVKVTSDDTIGNKLLWVTTPPWEKPTISGERLARAAAPLNVVRVNTGPFSGAANPSHMSPVGFPTAGCWRLEARLRDLSLVYVVEVVVAG